jgi:hypothetical protein
MQRKLVVVLLLALLLSGILMIGLKVSPVAATPVVDGVISPGEYDGGMAVQLVGRWNSSWTVNAYIVWDDTYLYVAVNESVPGTGGLSWIEFAIDPNPGSTSGYLYAFARFGTNSQGWDRNPKPSENSWAGLGAGNFSSASVSATEFRVKYADYGISYGDTIKMSIDRNKEPYPNGQAAFWPTGAVVYDGSPEAQPTTWGDVHLAPPQPTTYNLTVNSSPISGISYTVDSQAAVTGTAISLASGSHTIIMPSSITAGADTIRFAHWESISSTNPVRTIDLESDTVLTTTYSNHTIDGVISPGEYSDGIAVQLVGPYPPGAPFLTWTTNAYVSWDTQYLYVGVNESVPVPAQGKSTTSCWIEFQFNTSTALHSYVLFGDGTPQHVLYPLPSGPWGWDVPAGFNNPYPWYAATNTATEFQVKYTDFGIAYGDLLKMSIDRGKDDFTYPPLGQCSVWPYPCTFYPTADASTWGDVHLAPLGPTTQYTLTVNSVPISGISYTIDSIPAMTGTPVTLNNGSHTIFMPSTITSGSDSYQFTYWEDSSTNRVRTIDLQTNTALTATYTKIGPHLVDGVISPGEYEDGMAAQLVGRTDPLWTVNAYIAWDDQYLYVAVNEPVPPGGHNSWIEFEIDASSSRPYLDAFTFFGDNVLSEVRCPKPPGSWGGAPVSFIAASNTATEFRIKLTDFGINLGDTIKIAIDRNQGPAPPAPYGFAAFWPQNAVVYDGSPNPATWGNVTLKQPGLEFAVADPNPSKPFEYGKTFEIEAYASNISGYLTAYDFTIAYDSTLMKFLDVDYWGVLGTGHFDNETLGTIHIWSDIGSQSYTGSRGLLFALTFHVEFNDDIGHIWRTNSPHSLTAQISFTGAGLNYNGGTVSMSGIVMPLPEDVVIHLIQGDVNCDGKVDVSDLRCVAAYYDQNAPAGSLQEKYDLTGDGKIDLFDLVIVATMFGYNI